MNGRRLTLTALATLCALAGALLLSSVPALAASRYALARQLTGVSPGEPFGNPSALAVEQTFGDLYVVDEELNVVDEFDSSGVFIRKISGPSVSEPFNEAAGVAVGALGQLFVVDAGRDVVDEFDASGNFIGDISGPSESESFTALNGSIAVDQSSGDFYVGDSGTNVVDEFEPSGVLLRQISGTPSGTPRSGPFGGVRGLAVDGSGNVYVADQGNVVVDEFEASGTFLRQLSGPPSSAPVAGPFANTRALAVDQSTGSLDVADNFASPTVVDQFDANGDFETQLSGFSNPVALAVDESGDLYVADNETKLVSVYTSVVVPDLVTGSVSDQTEGAVTLNGLVKPDETSVTSCEFEYGTEAGVYTNTMPCSRTTPFSGEGSVPVSAELTGLKPRTVYHYRLVASNVNGSNQGEDKQFATSAHPLVEGESVTDVASSSATLGAQINAGLLDTTYRFEYGTTPSYGTSVPSPDADIGSGMVDVAVSIHLQSLQPSTVYHFRVVATNALGIRQGEDETFTTQPAGKKFSLPDGRRWEMVSPPTKHGATLEGIAYEGGLIQAAEDGGALAYVANAPIEADPAGNSAPALTEIMSRRAVDGGWSTREIATLHDQPTGIQVGTPDEYKFFSTDLSRALVEPLGESPLSEEASERAPYIRQDATCEASPTTCYQPLVTTANVPVGTKFGGPSVDAQGEAQFVGATSDLSHVVLQSGVALTSTPVQGQGGLYEWAAGKLQLVSLLPGGEGGTAVSGELGYGSSDDVRNAISDDGSRIVWHSMASHAPLYMRDMIDGQTVRLDAAEPDAAGGEGEPHFQTATSDGSRVFFTDSARLTVDSTALSDKQDLYEFDVENGKLTDLTVDSNPGESADVLGGVLGASEDGSYVYFVANGVLAQGAVPGQCSPNPAPGVQCDLYEWHNGITTLVAILSGEDAASLANGNLIGDLGNIPARVSPNGLWLAFMSNRSLAGYDNRDAYSGEPDEEVYLYDASVGRVICASCNPTGARPVGVFDSGEYPGLLVDRPGNWRGDWLAASIPGWTNVSVVKALYQSRYLSDSGRLFFNGNDALAPQDTNGTWDVYEYEPEGVDCKSASATFSESADGCVGLISSGTSGEESAFLDASSSGDDVFFLTAAKLVPEDYDSALDVYDAHVCTAASPCLAEPPASPPPCSTGDSCKAAPSPQPTIFGASASATFSGVGNVVSGSKPAVAPRSLSRAQKLAKALKACKKKRSKRKRATCERQAQKAYSKGAHTGTPKATKSLSARAKG